MNEAAPIIPEAAARPSIPPPALKDCVSLITASDASLPSSPGKKGELALSMMGFCYHMAIDQAKLSKLQLENKMNDLQLSEIPAMRELLSNPALFNTIVSMLTPPTLSQGANPQQQMTIGRKRAPSEDITHSRKRQMLSPIPNRQMHPNSEQKTHLPVESTSVWAATCLHTVLQHIDHWPIQIMTAFAEDSFGPRIWVDDERCSLIVANLEQSIKSRHLTLTDAMVSAAEEAEIYFSSLGKLYTKSKTILPTTTIPAQTKQSSSKEKRKLATDSKMDVDISSSSGEEEVLESEVLPSFSMTSVQEQSHSKNNSPIDALFSSSSPSTELVRQRYMSSNAELMYEVVSDAFEERLNSKSKQNSRLLQTLPLFLRIPRVRVLASRHLERWLQSPALAGLARTVFAEIVKHIKKVDPPLFDDLEVVDNILKLKLKANQLGIYVEHITAIVKTLPSVTRKVFTHCISQEDSSNESATDKLNVLRAVYMTLDKKDAAVTLASSIVALESEVIEAGSKMDEVMLQYKDLHAHMCKVVEHLSTSFDGFQFATSIIETKIGTVSKVSDALNSSRLIFLCTTLARDISSLQHHDEEVNSKELSHYRMKMLKLRKVIMRWCMKDLCSVYHKKIIQEEERKCADSQFERGAVVSGPGVANYRSALDADSYRNTSDQRSSFNDLMSVLRCLMFISYPPSSDMEFFLGKYSDQGHCNRVEFACKFGVDIDEELIQLVLTSDCVTPTTAISLIENLIERCNVSSTAMVVDFSSDTVMSMYKLTEYKPVLRNKVTTNFESNDECTSEEDDKHENRISCDLNASSLPRLAVTSLWWRVSCIALVLSGLSPKDVGAELWNVHPTMRALIRMTTSQKYRFPTAECDEAQRDKVKQMEARTRETEASIVEKLFMPPKPRNTDQPKTKSPTRAGIRVSARQREKQEKVRRIEEERNAAALHAEHLKLKKVLRSMQKNIMLFDPEQHQRKPPKGSIDLILSVNNHFGLAEKFRQVTTPDFLLQTIGEGRSAIERAYDWLIPIISSHAEIIIHRLQPNASCYLLLRAYGSTEGENNKELLDLTKPLLCHVKGCLTGAHGESHAMLAMELLMSDIADERVTRRVCARRVLQEAFGGENDTLWLSQVIHDKHSAVFVPLVGRAVSRACAVERGYVLSTYVLALSKYREFMQTNDFNFVSSLCDLINIRPHVFAEALERFPELRRLCIAEVKHAIDDAITHNEAVSPNDRIVTIFVKSQERILPSNLLSAFIVILSNWQKGETTEELEEENILALLKQLVTGEKDSVLSTAMRNGKRAVTVEEWVLLATSNSDIIAKQAALSVPDIFLPRLLLCCGMPKTSLVTMLERLSKLGASAPNPAKLYNDLICTSAVSEWGLQKGNRITIKKRLHGRIASYLRIFRSSMTDNAQDELNTIEKCAFVTWLASEVSVSNSKKSDSSTRCDEITNILESSAPSSFDERSFVDLEEDEMDLCIDEQIVIGAGGSKCLERYRADGILTEDFINSSVVAGQYKVLLESLEQFKRDAIAREKGVDVSVLVRVLMNSYASSNYDPSLGRVVLKFVPQLSQFCCDNLWQTIFISTAEKLIDEQYLLSLISGCVIHWSDEVIAACQEWILTQNDLKNALSMKLFLRFLVASSEQESIHCVGSNGNSASNFVCIQSKANAESTMKIVFQYLEMTNDKLSGTSCREERNNLPDWLLLSCIIAKSHQQCIVAMIIGSIDNNSFSAPAMYSVLLRLYLMSPTTSQWNDSKVRTHLKNAANHHTKTSLQWRCPLDRQVVEMLRNLGTSPHTRLLQYATDFSKGHALIVIRHIHVLHERLVFDGLGQDCTVAGRVGTRPPTVIAQIDDRLVKVSISRWGFHYNEFIWSTVLNFMGALPAELLFRCGIDTGVLLVLEDYLKLFYVHVMELGSEECISQLRPKYVALVKSFQACNQGEFQKWSKTDIAGFGTVHTLLLSKVGTFAS